jgi:hypothetical protein
MEWSYDLRISGMVLQIPNRAGIELRENNALQELKFQSRDFVSPYCRILFITNLRFSIDAALQGFPLNLRLSLKFIYCRLSVGDPCSLKALALDPALGLSGHQAELRVMVLLWYIPVPP